MKKLLPLFLFVIASNCVFSQFTQFQYLGNSKTLITSKGGLKADSVLVIPFYPDTAAANITGVANRYPGSYIRILGDLIYVRSQDTLRWVLSGSGSSNINIGSFYRLLVPSSQGIKGIAPGIDMLIDSSTNANSLTVHADTTTGATKLATQGDIDRAIAASSPALTLQQVFNQEVGGSVLTKIDTIDAGSSFKLKMLGSIGSSGQGILEANNSNTGGGGGVKGTGFFGVQGSTTASSGIGVIGSASGNTFQLAGSFTVDNSTTNSIIDVLKVSGTSSSTVTTNFGSAILFSNEKASGTVIDVGRIGYKYSDVTNSAEKTQVDITGLNGSGSLVNFLNIQQRYIRANNLADTVAYLSDVRAGGGGGSSSTFAESVKKTNDSVYLEGEKAHPFRTNTVYGDSAGVKGAHDAAVINENLIRDQSMIKYDSANHEYVVIKSDTLLQDLNFLIGDTGYPANGSTEIMIPALKNRKVKIHVSGILMKEGVHYTKTDDSTYTFYEALETGTPVQVETIASFITSTIDTAGISAVSGGSGCILYFVDFTTAGDLTETPTGTWGSAAGTGKGYSTTSLQIGADGSFQMTRANANNDQVAMGLTAEAGNAGDYNNWECTVYSYSGTYYYIENGAATVNTAIAVSNGDLVRINVTSGVIKAQYYRSGAWNDIHTYSGVTQDHILYAHAHLPIAGQTMKDAKVCGFE